MAKFSKSKLQRSANRSANRSVKHSLQCVLALLGLAGSAANAVSAPAAPLPERLKLEARVAQARQVLQGTAQAPAGTLLAQANNWNNWPNWSNWANWANG
jgi:hypothetical protein